MKNSLLPRWTTTARMRYLDGAGFSTAADLGSGGSLTSPSAGASLSFCLSHSLLRPCRVKSNHQIWELRISIPQKGIDSFQEGKLTQHCVSLPAPPLELLRAQRLAGEGVPLHVELVGEGHVVRPLGRAPGRRVVGRALRQGSCIVHFILMMLKCGLN